MAHPPPGRGLSSHPRSPPRAHHSFAHLRARPRSHAHDWLYPLAASPSGVILAVNILLSAVKGFGAGGHGEGEYGTGGSAGGWPPVGRFARWKWDILGVGVISTGVDDAGGGVICAGVDILENSAMACGQHRISVKGNMFTCVQMTTHEIIAIIMTSTSFTLRSQDSHCSTRLLRQAFAPAPHVA
ncbi:hypothetical protein COCMIDRAFT_26347 [Bipolaris oryzae ATCC 44560]|uniref:Uncharacterized protein n=1 Tax=Bipolaris oryzae ATCC 44560 TaxID=930090 RepID=W6Z6S0_COCMI|nr:uncharacterized protein COCMIDRAFT_26347 [Bipolaris oryzae ATCC 44560]EUC45518.1 hypothetical protein COCMIDRAFT_26347 [Bipolaris oryzae ATCC 44560]